MPPRRARRRGMMMGAAIANSKNKKSAQAAPAPAPSAPVTTGHESSDIDKLKQLAELKDQGILTQEEFDAKKKQILGL